jgi:hypothetical protein
MDFDAGSWGEPHATARMPVAVRRFAERSRAAIVALLAVGVSDLVLLLVGFWYASYLQGLSPYVVPEETDSHTSVLVYGLAALANLGVILIAAVCFILWFFRAYRNLDHITSLPRSYGDSWTAWGFIVPILSLYRPYAIMDEIRDRTEYRWDEQSGALGDLQRPEARVKLWWGLYLAKVLVESFTARLGWNATTAQETLASVNAEMFGTVLELVAVAPAVMIVQSITALQIPILSGASAAAPIAGMSDSPGAVPSTVSVAPLAEAPLPPPPPGMITG